MTVENYIQEMYSFLSVKYNVEIWQRQYFGTGLQKAIYKEKNKKKCLDISQSGFTQHTYYPTIDKKKFRQLILLSSLSKKFGHSKVCSLTHIVLLLIGF